MKLRITNENRETIQMARVLGYFANTFGLRFTRHAVLFRDDAAKRNFEAQLAMAQTDSNVP